MRKYRGQHLTKKLLCMVLSIAMVTGNAATSVMAAQTEAVEDSASQLQLTCETEAIRLPDNGRSTEIKLCLTQEDRLIQKKIFTEDVTLGGVFRNMIVHDDQQWYYEMPMTYFVIVSK